MSCQADAMKLTRSRALELIEGNLNDALRNLHDSHAFEGSAYIERNIKRLRDFLHMIKDPDQQS